jgi:uncharacterized membrane protein YhaH (DUF805 family)
VKESNMTMPQLLFSFSGRINRALYWGVFLGTVEFALYALGAIAALPVAVVAGDIVELALVGVILTGFFTPLLWITFVVGAKRLHDRNKSAWWLLLYYVLPLILQLPLLLNDVPQKAKLVLLVIGIAIYIWGFVELAFLRGTVGPNRFGPDLLQAREVAGATA